MTTLPHHVVLKNGREDIVCACGEHFRSNLSPNRLIGEDAIRQWVAHYRETELRSAQPRAVAWADLRPEPRSGDEPTPLVKAALDAIKQRLTWPSIHWRTEAVHDDAWVHIARAALLGAAEHTLKDPVAEQRPPERNEQR